MMEPINPNVDGGEPSGGGEPVEGGTPNFVEFIPETYKDTPWVKQNATNPDNFFKWVDNLEKTVGKKGVIVPGDNAAPEEWNNYYKSLGRPDKPEDYVFEPIPEFKDLARSPEKEIAFKKMLHDAGTPKNMATKLQQNFDKYVYTEQQALLAENKKIDEAFNSEVTKMFGEQKDTALANAKKLLNENAAPEIRTKLETLDNDSLLVLASALDGIVKKYVSEDGFTGGLPAPGSGGDTYESLSAQQRELMKNPAFTSFMHPDHQKIMAQNNDIMTKMRNIKR